jgi:hypothetical protein
MFVAGGTVTLADSSIDNNAAAGGAGGVGGFGGSGGSALWGSAGNGGSGGRGGNAGYFKSGSNLSAGFGGRGGRGGNDGNGASAGSGGAGANGGNGGDGGVGYGGGLYLSGGTLMLNADTVSRNTASGGAGGAGGAGGFGGPGFDGGLGGFGSFTSSGGTHPFNNGGNGGSLGATVTHILAGVPGKGGTGGNGGDAGNGGNGGLGGNGGRGGNGGNGYAGGLYISNGSLTVYNSTLADNAAAGGAPGGGGGAGSGGFVTSFAPGGPAGRGGYSNGGHGAEAPSGIAGNSGIAGKSGAPGQDGAAGTGSGGGFGGGLYASGGSVTLYNATIALNFQGGAVQVGGAVKAWNTIFAENGTVDYSNAGGAAHAYRSLFETPPTGVTESHDLDGVNPELDPNGLQWNGGPTQTIAIVSAASPAIGKFANPQHLFTDQRGYVPTKGAWDMGAYQYGATLAAAPTATLSASNVTKADYGQTSYTFSITYASNAAIAQTSLSAAVAQVVPPSSDGPPITATVVNVVANGPTDPWGDAQSFTVTYEITPPGGSWTSADNGTYSVTLGGSPVRDVDGNPVATGTVGTFSVVTSGDGVTRHTSVLQPETAAWSDQTVLTSSSPWGSSAPTLMVLVLPPAVSFDDGTTKPHIHRNPTLWES